MTPADAFGNLVFCLINFPPINNLGWGEEGGLGGHGGDKNVGDPWLSYFDRTALSNI